MGNISDIENSLRSIDERVSNHIDYLEEDRNEIVEAMNKAQEQFGKDRNGQSAVMAMFQALNALSTVDGILYVLKMEIQNYIGNIKK